jgi:cell division protein FtsW (lipid II flippase)
MQFYHQIKKQDNLLFFLLLIIHGNKLITSFGCLETVAGHIHETEKKLEVAKAQLEQAGNDQVNYLLFIKIIFCFFNFKTAARRKKICLIVTVIIVILILVLVLGLIFGLKK